MLELSIPMNYRSQSDKVRRAERAFALTALHTPPPHGTWWARVLQFGLGQVPGASQRSARVYVGVIHPDGVFATLGLNS
jgi:hypothetical protein